LLGELGGNKVEKILVTGGAGFIGSNFIRYLLKENQTAEILNLDMLSFGSNTENLSDLKANSHYSFVKGDICNHRLVQKLVADVDSVLNFAAESHVDRSIASPSSFIKTNTLGVHSILEAIRKSRRNIRFIQVGTDEEYGEILNGSFKEEDSLHPSSPYAASKAAASMLIHAYHRTYGIDAIITRCTNNFGPYQFPEKLIPKTIIRAMKNLSIPIYGSGKQVRDWIYVEDHSEALYTVLKKGKSGEVYNISSGNEFDNLTIVKKILRIIGKDEVLIKHVGDRPGHDIRYSLDSSKIRNKLGWKPKHGFDEALENTVKWYLEHEGWWGKIASEKVLSMEPWKENW
jgi:dTDP-glucose 4,6-dehydratase